MTPIVVPELGLAPDEPLAVSCWLVRLGDSVVEGDRLVELICSELTIDLASPATGRLAAIHVEEDEAVAPGTVLGVIEPETDG